MGTLWINLSKQQQQQQQQHFIHSCTSLIKYIYYMEESVLLGTKPLVDSIRHSIRDPSGVFSVCRLCGCRIVLVSTYNKKNITRWLKGMNFMFSWEEQYLTRSLRSLVRYGSCHSNIKFISSRHRVITSISLVRNICVNRRIEVS